MYKFKETEMIGTHWQVHFDCVYRSITAVSSRESKLLAGNRTIAQVIATFEKKNLEILLTARFETRNFKFMHERNRLFKA